ATRATVFVEPPEVIELGNELRAAEAAEQREVLRVLRELSELARPQREAIARAWEMCIAFDDLCARARYAIEVNGFAPAIGGGPLVIRNGRHPLLTSPPSEGSEVVPFDLALAPDEFPVLVSGPNTGGKTVLIKAVGLLCLMAQSGIIPPLGPQSTLPVFDAVFADIGDRQSIAASLSTFSAHVAALRDILEHATAGSLVLLDEIGSGTDPAEGGALAAAVLRTLTRRRVVTLATTHLGALKQLAAQTVGIVNASLQFEAETLTPTYRLLKGVPGRSYGLAIARRLGLPPDVLDLAERAVPDAMRCSPRSKPAPGSSRRSSANSPSGTRRCVRTRPGWTRGRRISPGASARSRRGRRRSSARRASRHAPTCWKHAAKSKRRSNERAPPWTRRRHGRHVGSSK